MQAANASIRDGKRNNLLNSVDKNGDLLVARLVKLLIIKHKENFDGTITYQDEVNYRNLHAVIAYINNYYSKQEPVIEQIKIQGFQNIPIKKPEVIVKTKTRKKVTTPLEGQLSFLI